ncbi:MAG: hypothetical protein IBX45_12170 [Campylobacterales bacterium]|nr:hypothetical protein [Campylobacterales bacterium]
MSRPSHHFFSPEGENTTTEFKSQLSPVEELQNAYFGGSPDLRALVTRWSEGEAYIARTLTDEIAVEQFVRDMLTKNTTNRSNCGIKAALRDLQNGEKKLVAKRIASYARLGRDAHAGAIAGATIQAHEAEFAQEQELLGAAQKTAYEVAVEAGLPLALEKTRKKYVQVRLGGAEFHAAQKLPCKPENYVAQAQKTASFQQATLF